MKGFRAFLLPAALLFPLASTRAADCDLNGFDDSVQLANGSSRDCNGNGVPDQCDLGASFLDLEGPEAFPLEDSEHVMVAADFDRDGDFDLAIANSTVGKISLLLNTGRGAFAARVEFAVPSPRALVAADLDRDGDVDLATAGSADQVYVLRNDGNASFGPAQGYPAGPAPFSLVAADLDRDGAPDLAVANRISNDVSILLNDGHGSFSEAKRLPVGKYPDYIAAGDLDGDLFPELVVGCTWASEIWFFWSEGPATFSPGVSISIELPPYAISPLMRDLDGDGDLDVVMQGWGLSAFLNYGTRNLRRAAFTESELLAGVPEGGGGSIELHASLVSLQDPRILLIWDKSSDIPFFCFNPAVVSVDLDGDRRPDIAKAGHFLSVLFNRSDGTFSARNDYVVGRYPVFASRGDLDADLMPDLAVVNLESDSISVLFHKEHGEFVKGSAIPTGRNPTALAIADFEGDQRMDLAVTHQSSPFLSLHSHPTRNSGSAAPKNVDLGRGQFFVIAADLDGDGDPDLALSLRDTVEDRGDANLSVLLHQGAGEFSAPLEIRPGVSHWIEASDVNGDGELDLVSLLDNQPTLLLNSALGQFEARTVPLEFGHYPSSIRAGDLDDDGLPDLVLPSAFDFVTVLTNAGEAGFKKPSTFHLGRSVGSTSVAIADLDLDGKADLAVTNDVLNDLTLFVNLGGGSFRASNHVQLLGKPVLAVPGDFDLDNVPDLAILNDHFASVLLNRSGRFEFVASTDRSELRGYRPLASGDFDGDGRGDVALASPDALGRGGVAIASNLGAGVFGTPAEYPASFAPVQGRSADLDQDDDLDLLIVGTDGSSVLLNDGRGSLREASTYSRSGFPCQPLTDLDGDADLDLAFATGRFNEVVPFFNRGDGTFEQGTALAIADSWYLVPADLNQDGRPDLAVTTPISGQVRTIRNDGPLKFSIWNQYRVGGLPQAIARGDLDEDGDVDLAVVNGDTKDLAVLLNTGDGSFSPIHRFGAMRVVPEFIAAVDLDRDGRLDLAVLSNFLEVFPNIGEGRFGPGIRLWAGTGSSAVMADLDGNGPDDFVVSGSDGGVLFLRNKAKSLSSTDCNTNGVPDECDPDCNANGVPDFCDISAATSRDCNRNSTPDECDLQGGGSLDGNVNGVPDECDPRPLFHRGDSNTDGVFDVSDCLCTLQFLFEDGESPSCLESADANNDGRIDCSDAVFTVGFLFLGLADPPAPGPSAPCGPDTDPFGVPEDLGCGEYRPCD